MFYEIIFWLGIGILIGIILSAFFWILVVVTMAKEGNLYLRKDDKSEWLPKNPFK